MELNGRTYKNYIDGYNLLDYLSGKVKESPRKEFIYVNDDGEIVAIRIGDWKVVYLENRGEAFGVWREPFVQLRVPLLFNLRRDPFEKSQHNSNTYNDWLIDRAFVLVPITEMASKFLMTMKEYPPSQTAGSFNLSKMQKQIEALSRQAATSAGTSTCALRLAERAPVRSWSVARTMATAKRILYEPPVKTHRKPQHANKTSSPPRSLARWLSPQPSLALPTRSHRGTTARPSSPSSTSSRR